MTDEDHRSVVGHVADLGRHALTQIPAQYLALLVLNVAFIVGTAWLEVAQNASRERVLMQIMTSCLQRGP